MDFPLSRNFYVRVRVKFTWVNEMEAMNEKLRLNIKVEPRSTFTFTRLLFIHCLYFIYYARKIYARTHVKLVQQFKSTFNLLVMHAC